MVDINNFPDLLKNALKNKKVTLPEDIIENYTQFEVYRAVRYNESKHEINETDFLSYAECPIPINPIDDKDINNYNCSFFQDEKEMEKRTKFPTKNKAIAEGTLNDTNGPIVYSEGTHVGLFRYKNAKLAKFFKVVKTKS